ncbi:unnamed protein product [Paramecium primaurelia]|uniref:Uncharacterized protein n=1 Tax=Paramecium primaurelia TaxID=5886 RepID=A0A8S1LFA8_PARPR|nr:unnamed protein product [Paramecium primaurelia]
MVNTNKIEKDKQIVSKPLKSSVILKEQVKQQISQNEMCKELKFNSKNSLIFTGNETKIKIHVFHEGFLYKICEFYHSNNILTYLNCKKDTILISACDQMIQMRALFDINNKKFQRTISIQLFCSQSKKQFISSRSLKSYLFFLG